MAVRKKSHARRGPHRKTGVHRRRKTKYGGALLRKRILGAAIRHGLSPKQARMLMRRIRGKGFFDTLKNIGSKIYSGVKKGVSWGNKAIQFAAPLLQARGLGQLVDVSGKANQILNGDDETGGGIRLARGRGIHLAGGGGLRRKHSRTR